MHSRVAKLPQYKGIPIPFNATYRTDGTPDFKVVNEENRWRCANERLCWICGEPLEYWIVFVGGPRSCENRLFIDGPMHEECALDAVEICPFLAGRMDYAKTFDLSKHDPALKLEERVSHPPPEKIGLYKTRGFEVKTARNSWFFFAGKAKQITWVDRKSQG